MSGPLTLTFIYLFFLIYHKITLTLIPVSLINTFMVIAFLGRSLMSQEIPV